MKKRSRIFALILAIICCFSVYGCARPSENDLLSAYSALYDKAKAVNAIIYGAGLPYVGEYDTEELDSPYFVEVSPDSPYKSRAEIEQAVLAVYSEEFYQNTLAAVLFDGSVPDENGIMGITPRYKESGGVLYVDVTYNQSIKLLDSSVSEAKAVKIKRKSAELKVPRSGAKDKTVYLVLTEGGWRFDALSQ